MADNLGHMFIYNKSLEKEILTEFGRKYSRRSSNYIPAFLIFFSSAKHVLSFVISVTLGVTSIEENVFKS